MRSAAWVREGGAQAQRSEQTLPAQRHLCFVAPHLWPVLSRDTRIPMVGGAEVQQSILARAFARAGYRVSVITLDFGQPQRSEIDGITVHKTFRSADGVPVLRFLHPRLTSTWRALKQADADIYYVRSASMLAGIVARYCRRYGRRCVYAGASDADFVPGHRQIRLARDRLLYEHGLRSVDHIVVQNQTQLESCRRNFGRAATLIPSCYELPAGSGNAAKELVLWAGTVHDNKRAELFLELARRLPQRRFVLIGGPGHGSTSGSPGYYQRIRSAAAALPNVECTGFLPLAQAETWFDRARVLVNTSVYEGMPNTFLQAWARGVPTLASVDVGAPVHTVFSEPEGAARHIDRLFTDDSWWSALSRRCRQHFERNHSTAAVLAQYERVFEALCE